MTDFNYTDALEDIDSSAVDAAYYNVNDKTLAIITQTSDTVYRYTGVPSWVWSAFKEARSKGTYFATRIKRDYGPSTVLGYEDDIVFYDNNKVASVTPLRTGGYVSLTPAPAQPTAAAGTPKGLSDPATSSSVSAFGGNAVGVRKATTTVYFESNGDKSVDFDDQSTVDEALAEFNRITSMLGMDAVVKAVTVHFE
jgi:hypothetical protein